MKHTGSSTVVKFGPCDEVCRGPPTGGGSSSREVQIHHRVVLLGQPAGQREDGDGQRLRGQWPQCACDESWR